MPQQEVAQLAEAQARDLDIEYNYNMTESFQLFLLLQVAGTFCHTSTSSRWTFAQILQ